MAVGAVEGRGTGLAAPRARTLGHQASGIQQSDIRWVAGSGLPNALAGQPSVLADQGWDTRTEYRRMPNVSMLIGEDTIRHHLCGAVGPSMDHHCLLMS
jgi:hypothetical protein